MPMISLRSIWLGRETTRRSWVIARQFICSLWIALPATVVASEGLLQIMVYRCNPDSLTEKAVGVCVRNFPKLSRQADIALSSWRQRNADEAVKSARECRKEVSETIRTEAEMKKFETSIKKLESDWVESFAGSMSSRGVDKCERFLRELSDGAGDLRHFKTEPVSPKGAP